MCTQNQALAIELVVDRQLNERILRYMVNFFLLVGVVSFLILGVAFVGVVIASSKDDFIPIDPDRSVSPQLATILPLLVTSSLLTLPSPPAEHMYHESARF